MELTWFFIEGKWVKRIIVGGHSEQNNLFIAEHICKILDEKCPRKDGVTYATQITFVEDRAGHNRRYAIDATKIETELRWKAQENFHTGIAKTIDWYLIKILGNGRKEVFL